MACGSGDRKPNAVRTEQVVAIALQPRGAVRYKVLRSVSTNTELQFKFLLCLCFIIPACKRPHRTAHTTLLTLPSHHRECHHSPPEGVLRRPRIRSTASATKFFTTVQQGRQCFVRAIENRTVRTTGARQTFYILQRGGNIRLPAFS